MATDRLRRRLRDVDSDDLATLTESFCSVGTPLPDLNTHKKDQNELKPIWQQEARDAQGRRRFHGAFTGGFSAGYYNTVGSKEGWTPGSFRSSRADKAAGKQAPQYGGSRLEDFMDEEDLQDWKRAQQVTTSTPGGSVHQDNLVAGLRQAEGDSTGVSLDSVWEQLGSSENDSVGFRLLRQMGWKDGQGLGPRVDAKKKARLISLVSRGNTIATSSDITLEDLKHLYAPPPTPLLISSAKRSRQGLGADDKPTLSEALVGRAPPSKFVERTSESKSSSADVWPDGRPLPPGFRLAAHLQPAEPEFPSSSPPNGWQPDPSRVWKRLGSTPSADQKQDNLSPASRGQLLGEAKIPGPPPSIEAFLSEKARERLAAENSGLLPNSSTPVAPRTVQVPRLDIATAKEALRGSAPFGTDEAKKERYRDYLKSQIDAASERASRLPVPPSLTAEQWTNELQEFAKSATIFRPMSSAIASRFTTASAAVIAHEAQATSATPGLRHRDSGTVGLPLRQKEDDDVKSDLPKKELSVAQKAAHMGNFGHLTRTVEPWAPERLLCKRFGVPEPAISRRRRAEGEEAQVVSGKAGRPESEDEKDPFYGSTKSTKKKSEVQVDQHWERNKAQLKALAAGPTPLSLEAQSATQGLAAADVVGHDGGFGEVGLGDDERQGRDTLTYVKPSMDVFKAIFESDDEGSDGDQAVKAVQPKLQDPASGAGVVFQSRSKRKDTGGSDPNRVSPASQGEKKRKKNKASKNLLTFDLEEEAQSPLLGVTPKGKGKPRTKASDLF